MGNYGSYPQQCEHTIVSNPQMQISHNENLQDNTDILKSDNNNNTIMSTPLDTSHIDMHYINMLKSKPKRRRL